MPKFAKMTRHFATPRTFGTETRRDRPTTNNIGEAINAHIHTLHTYKLHYTTVINVPCTYTHAYILQIYMHAFKIILYACTSYIHKNMYVYIQAKLDIYFYMHEHVCEVHACQCVLYDKCKRGRGDATKEPLETKPFQPTS